MIPRMRSKRYCEYFQNQICWPGLVAHLDARPPGIQMVTGSILRSSKTFFHEDWSQNHFYGHSLPTTDSSRTAVSYSRKAVHQVLVNHSGLSLPRKSVVRLTDHLDMTIVVDWDVKTTKQTKRSFEYISNLLLLTFAYIVLAGVVTKSKCVLAISIHILAMSEII